MKEFNIQILGLPKKEHDFSYSLGKDFFAEYNTDLVENGQFSAHILLDCKDTFIQAYFKMKGSVTLICDRTMESFEYPIVLDQMLMFKYGETEEELSEDVVQIPWDKEVLDMGRYMYEFIALAIPAKKLHPREQEKDLGDQVIYSSNQHLGKETDPRWEVLKSLTKTN